MKNPFRKTKDFDQVNGALGHLRNKNIPINIGGLPGGLSMAVNTNENTLTIIISNPYLEGFDQVYTASFDKGGTLTNIEFGGKTLSNPKALFNNLLTDLKSVTKDDFGRLSLKTQSSFVTEAQKASAPKTSPKTSVEQSQATSLDNRREVTVAYDKRAFGLSFEFQSKEDAENFKKLLNLPEKTLSIYEKSIGINPSKGMGTSGVYVSSNKEISIAFPDSKTRDLFYKALGLTADKCNAPRDGLQGDNAVYFLSNKLNEQQSLTTNLSLPKDLSKQNTR